MRPGQQNNKRMRGRGRKGPNPLSRSYESNGPDVKIRGTAQHIAEKYATLARDATSAGDRVMAENYFQHAEHYGRIVAAAQGSFQPAQVERDFDGDEDEAEEGGDFGGMNRHDGGRNNQYRDRNDGQHRQDGGRDRGEHQFRDRNERGEGHRDRNERGEGHRDRQNDRERNHDRDRDHNRDRNFQPRDRDRREGQGGYGQNRENEQRDASLGEGAAQNERGPRQDRNGGERRFEDRAPRRERENEHSGTPDEAAPAAAASEAPGYSAPVDADALQAEAPRRRGRPRRQPLAESTQAEVPSGLADSPASVSADAPVQPEAAAEPAPRRRGRPPKAASDAAQGAGEDPSEAPAKRKPGRPRKVKAEGEGSEGENAENAESTLPAFLLASNG